MNIRLILGATAVALAMAATSAQALTYATSITPEGGSTNSTLASNDTRTDSGNALGAPDGKFFSLGLGKFADFTFGTSFVDTGTVWEVTFGNSTAFPEFADISVYDSVVGLVGAEHVATIRNNTAQTGAVFTFAGIWDTLRIQDVTVRECDSLRLEACTTSGSITGDGFDVDAVGVQAIPLPAAAWLLLGVSGALIGAKRRQARKAA